MAEKKNAMVAVYNTHVEAEAGIKEPQKVGFAMKKLSIVGVRSRCLSYSCVALTM